MHPRSGHCPSCGQRQYVALNKRECATNILAAVFTVGLWFLACKFLSIPTRIWKCTACDSTAVTDVRKSSSSRHHSREKDKSRFMLLSIGIAGTVLALILLLMYMIYGNKKLLTISLVYIFCGVLALCAQSIMAIHHRRKKNRSRTSADKATTCAETASEPAIIIKPDQIQKQPVIEPTPQTQPASVEKQKEDSKSKNKKKAKRRSQRKARKKNRK